MSDLMFKMCLVRCLFTAFFCWVMAVSLPANAQPAGFKKVGDVAALKRKFADEAKELQSIKAKFIQEKTLSMLAEKMVSEGSFWFKRANKIRLEYTKPFRYLLILNQNAALIRDEQKESRIPAQASRALKQVNRLLADVMEGKILDNADFVSVVYESDQQYFLEVTPKSRSLSGIYASFHIFAERKDLSVTLMELLERNGDKTVMKFSEKQFNSDLPESLFAVH